jgi:hypothetical protein
VCHYQVHIRSHFKSLLAYEGDPLNIKFLHNPSHDYSNAFMVVCNTVQATMYLNENISWGSIHTLINGNESSLSPSSSNISSLSSSSSSSSTLSRKRKRQDIKNFVDFRWTTSTCQSRAGSTRVALHRLKLDTEIPVVAKLFTGTSRILHELEIPWIDSKQNNIFLN